MTARPTVTVRASALLQVCDLIWQGVEAGVIDEHDRRFAAFEEVRAELLGVLPLDPRFKGTRP